MPFPSRRLAPVIVLRLCRRPDKASVVLRQMLFSQIRIRGLIARDLLPPQFLNQTILMYPVGPLDPPLCLRRTGGYDPNSQLLTHAPELRHRHLTLQLLGGRGFSFVHILPIRVECTRHTVLPNPGLQDIGCRPDGLFFAHTSLRFARGIVDPVHPTAPPTTPLQTIM